ISRTPWLHSTTMPPGTPPTCRANAAFWLPPPPAAPSSAGSTGRTGRPTIPTCRTAPSKSHLPGFRHLPGHALRAILFALLAMAIAWAQMAITADAGGSVHHAILLWPLPQMVIAISFAAASRRLGRAGVPALAVVLAVLMVSGLLVTNEYRVLIVRNGGSRNWTDAIFRLADYLKDASAGSLFCEDWGIMDSLRLLSRGKLPLVVGTDPFTMPAHNDAEREFLANAISQPDHLFINHTKNFEFFEGVNDQLVKYAAAAGYRREIMAVIPDSHGRPVYEVYRFVGQ